MLEQLFDLVAVGGGAALVVASGGMHQQGHGALQLLLPLPPLRVCQPRLQLIDAPYLRLQHCTCVNAMLWFRCTETRVCTHIPCIGYIGYYAFGLAWRQPTLLQTIQLLEAIHHGEGSSNPAG